VSLLTSGRRSHRQPPIPLRVGTRVRSTVVRTKRGVVTGLGTEDPSIRLVRWEGDEAREIPCQIGGLSEVSA
jgi:hypothetical protein